MKDRPHIVEYWLRVAEDISRRGTCPRLHVGAVVVDEHGVVVSSGYNGAPRTLPHCEEVGCYIEEETGRCKRTVHAETNALLQAGRSAWGGTLYCTHQPCAECSNLILNAGIKAVYYMHPYTTQRQDVADEVRSRFQTAGVTIHQYTP